MAGGRAYRRNLRLLPRKVPVEGRPDFFAVLVADFGALELQSLLDRERR